MPDSEGGLKLDITPCDRGIDCVVYRKRRPVHICSDNGPEFIVKRVRGWLEKLQIRPLYIEPGSPWEIGYIESFNIEIFYSMIEAQVLIKMWRKILQYSETS